MPQPPKACDDNGSISAKDTQKARAAKHVPLVATCIPARKYPGNPGTIGPMRRPRWQEDGSEPDYRFSLANERTFLAWIRTALALLAGGVLLEQFVTRIEPRLAVVTLAVGLALLAAVLCGAAYVRWKANEIAMRHARPLPASLTIPLISVAALTVAAMIAMLLLLQ